MRKAIEYTDKDGNYQVLVDFDTKTLTYAQMTLRLPEGSTVIRNNNWDDLYLSTEYNLWKEAIDAQASIDSAKVSHQVSLDKLQVTHVDKTFQASEMSIIRMGHALNLLGPGDTILWRDSSNTAVTVTREGLESIYQKALIASQGLWANYLQG